jgi:uncharacterized membrane protein YvbJ
MGESVSTGGSMQFRYKKGHKPQMKEEEKYEIQQAYNEYYERRKREKRRRKWILIAVVVLVILLGVLYFVSR